MNSLERWISGSLRSLSLTSELLGACRDLCQTLFKTHSETQRSSELVKKLFPAYQYFYQPPSFSFKYHPLQLLFKGFHINRKQNMWLENLRDFILNPLSVNPTKWSNTLTQFVGCCRRTV